MHLLIVIVASILIAVYLMREPGALRSLLIGFSIPFILLVSLAIFGSLANQ